MNGDFFRLYVCLYVLWYVRLPHILSIQFSVFYAPPTYTWIACRYVLKTSTMCTYVRKARWILRVIRQEEPLNRQGTVKIAYGVGESEREPAVPPKPRNKEKNDEEYGERGIELGVLLTLPKRGRHSYSKGDSVCPPRIARRERPGYNKLRATDWPPRHRNRERTGYSR